MCTQYKILKVNRKDGKIKFKDPTYYCFGPVTAPPLVHIYFSKFQHFPDPPTPHLSANVILAWSLMVLRMPPTILKPCSVDTHANNPCLYMSMLCPQLCVRFYCQYTLTVTVVSLTDQSIPSIQGTPHTHDTHSQDTHRQSQMLSFGSPTKNDRLKFTIILAERGWKSIHCIQIYMLFFNLIFLFFCKNIRVWWTVS